MSRAYTHTGTIFTAGETAPEAKVAIGNSAIIPNNFGNIALKGFKVDPTNQLSEVTYDTTVEPPVLRLNEALATAISGYIDPNGDFVAHTEQVPGPDRLVTGTYAGPGSELFVV